LYVDESTGQAKADSISFLFFPLLPLLHATTIQMTTTIQCRSGRERTTVVAVAMAAAAAAAIVDIRKRRKKRHCHRYLSGSNNIINCAYSI